MHYKPGAAAWGPMAKDTAKRNFDHESASKYEALHCRLDELAISLYYLSYDEIGDEISICKYTFCRKFLSVVQMGACPSTSSQNE
mmetsp:Transcript_39514/g.64680  ORF Transcript_39514/g.64680 Transcript_39514/m.64680 type:complete len:85 (-) Transcript_39514:89-343(-)